jgi:hypothetical protein
MEKFQVPAGSGVNPINQHGIEDLHQRINPGYFTPTVSALPFIDYKTQYGYQTDNPYFCRAKITG